MKKISSVLFALLVAAVAVVSCEKKQTPEQVAEKFLKHLAKAEYKEAMNLATGDAEKMVCLLCGIGLEVAPQDKKEQKEANIKDMKCEVTGDSATCTYKQDDNDGKLFMKKVEGKWKVSNIPIENGFDMTMNDDVTEEKEREITPIIPKQYVVGKAYDDEYPEEETQ